MKMISRTRENIGKRRDIDVGEYAATFAAMRSA